MRENYIMKKILLNKDGPKTIPLFLAKKEDSLNKEFFLNHILKEKVPQYTEIEVSFFELCNLHCSFCWQDNYSTVGITSIAKKADIVIDYLKREEKLLRPAIQVHMLGGELFEDSNDYYKEYKDFILRIKQYCDEGLPLKNLTFVFLTNMNFQKNETIKKLESFLRDLEENNCSFILTTSWDPTGRPLKGEVNTRFHYNITHFKKYLSEITFVLTRPTIYRLIQDENKYLDLLVEQGFQIDFDYYMPTSNTEKMMPSDRELLLAFRYLIKKYPFIRKLSAWVKTLNTPQKITCASLSKITVLPDGTITNCRHLNYLEEDFDTPIMNESNSDMILNFISKKECLSCSYFSKCPMSCFLMSDHKFFSTRQELDKCFYKILFDEKNE